MADWVNRTGCLTTLLIFIGLPLGYCAHHDYKAIRNAPVADLEAGKILYYGRMAGIFVYELSDRIAEQISKEGLSFFSRPENKARRYGNQVRFSHWIATPVKGIDSPNYDVLSVDKNIRVQVDEALKQPGSFYSDAGNFGLLIVIPETRRVVFSYHD